MQVATCDGPPPAVPHLIPVVSRHRYGFVHFADTEEGEAAAEHAIAKLGTAVAFLRGRQARGPEAATEGEAPLGPPIELPIQCHFGRRQPKRAQNGSGHGARASAPPPLGLTRRRPPLAGESSGPMGRAGGRKGNRSPSGPPAGPSRRWTRGGWGGGEYGYTDDGWGYSGGEYGYAPQQMLYAPSAMQVLPSRERPWLRPATLDPRPAPSHPPATRLADAGDDDARRGDGWPTRQSSSDGPNGFGAGLCRDPPPPDACCPATAARVRRCALPFLRLAMQLPRGHAEQGPRVAHRPPPAENAPAAHGIAAWLVPRLGRSGEAGRGRGGRWGQRHALQLKRLRF